MGARAITFSGLAGVGDIVGDGAKALTVAMREPGVGLVQGRPVPDVLAGRPR